MSSTHSSLSPLTVNHGGCGDGSGGGSSSRTTAPVSSPPPPPSTPINVKRWNEMITRLDQMQSEIHALQRRNFEKDRGKEFESSYTRVIFLMAVTYFTLLAYMALVIQSNHPYLDAIVPTVGFNISTWSLPYVKEWWIQARHYYLHGETEHATSLRRLMVTPNEEQQDDNDDEEEKEMDDNKNINNNKVITIGISAQKEKQTDVECGNCAVEVVTATGPRKEK
jgi:hypothetical protein